MERRDVLKYLAGTAAVLCPTCLTAAEALASGKKAAAAKGAAEAHGGGQPHWGYAGDGGPEHWGDMTPGFRVCDLGLQQSPVNLENPVRADFGDIGVHYRNMPLRVVNNGHTIQVDCEPGSRIVLGGTDYKLLQFHFHHPSEHLFAGRRYDMEAHFVHVSESGVLAVLGVFLSPGARNDVLAPIWDVMPRDAGAKASGGTIAPASLLPADRGGFRYLGSLTTPPCSEKVIWTVFGNPVEMSSGQVQKFAAMFPMNARPPQDLHRRFLLRSL